MKATIATLLCIGMVAATPNQLQTAQPLRMVNCLAGDCPLDYFVGTWKAHLSDSSVFQKSGCGSLYYQVSFLDKYAGDVTREQFIKKQKNPDHYRVGSIREACGTRRNLLNPTGTPVVMGVGFKVPSIPQGMFLFEKLLLWLNTYHNTFYYGKRPEAEMFESVKSVWVRDTQNLPLGKLNEFLDIAAPRVYK